MVIKAKSKSTIQELLEAREWHWKKHGTMQYWWYVAGIEFLIIGVFVASSEDRTLGIYLLIFGAYCILRKKILEYRFRQKLKSIPGIDKEVEWEISMNGISQNSDLGKSNLNWSSIYQSCTTQKGYLIYPQKDLYYWIPRSGFLSQDDYGEAGRIFMENTENKNIA